MKSVRNALSSVHRSRERIANLSVRGKARRSKAGHVFTGCLRQRSSENAESDGSRDRRRDSAGTHLREASFRRCGGSGGAAPGSGPSVSSWISLRGPVRVAGRAPSGYVFTAFSRGSSPTRCSPGKKNPTGAILAAARVSHRPRRDFLAGESIPSLLLDGIEGFAPGLPCFEVPSASRSTHPCSPDHPHAPQIPGMGCSPPHIALLSGLEGTGMTGRQITDVMSSIAIQFGQVPGRLLPRCK